MKHVCDSFQKPFDSLLLMRMICLDVRNSQNIDSTALIPFLKIASPIPISGMSNWRNNEKENLKVT